MGTRSAAWNISSVLYDTPPFTFWTGDGRRGLLQEYFKIFRGVGPVVLKSIFNKSGFFYLLWLELYKWKKVRFSNILLADENLGVSKDWHVNQLYLGIKQFHRTAFFPVTLPTAPLLPAPSHFQAAGVSNQSFSQTSDFINSLLIFKRWLTFPPTTVKNKPLDHNSSARCPLTLPFTALWLGKVLAFGFLICPVKMSSVYRNYLWKIKSVNIKEALRAVARTVSAVLGRRSFCGCHAHQPSPSGPGPHHLSLGWCNPFLTGLPASSLPLSRLHSMAKVTFLKCKPNHTSALLPAVSCPFSSPRLAGSCPPSPPHTWPCTPAIMRSFRFL